MPERPTSAPLADAARAARRLGVLGGSFDPPHAGHLHAARRARAAFALDHVVLVPAARPPHKPEQVLAPGAERVAMLRLLLADEPGVSVWDHELAREGPSWTVDTLRALRAATGARLFLIVGDDNLAGLPRWREADEVLALAQPIVVRREGAVDEPPGVDRLAPASRTLLRAGVLRSEALAVSSSALRAALARGEVPAEHFPPALAEYLRASGLYRGR